MSIYGKRTEEYNSTLNERRTASLRQFERLAAVASIILPKSISLTIAQIEGEIDSFEQEQDWDQFSFVTLEAELLRNHYWGCIKSKNSSASSSASLI